MLVLCLGPNPGAPGPGVVGASGYCGPSDSRLLFVHTHDAITVTRCFPISVNLRNKLYFNSLPGNSGSLPVLNNFNTVPDLPYRGSNSKAVSCTLGIS